MSVKSRLVGTLGAAALITGAAVGFAGPASAADFAASCDAPTSTINVSRGAFVGGTVTVQNTAGADTCNITTSGTSGVVTWTSSNGSDAPTQNPTTVRPGATITFTMATAGTEVVTLNAGSLYRTYNYTFTVTGGGGGGGTSSSPAVAPTETLSLATTSAGATCTGGNPSGVSGAWLTLPSADQCTPSGSSVKAGAKLLGWSTSAAFPIARAQAQVDKKWGVIDETIDGVRMIFIPAGMATFVSGSNNLYPVWSA